jgi:hypothetical protein
MTPEQHKTVMEALKRVSVVDDDCDILAPALADAVGEAIAIMEADHMPDASTMVSPVPSDAYLLRQALDALDELETSVRHIWNDERINTHAYVARDIVAALRARLGFV